MSGSREKRQRQVTVGKAPSASAKAKQLEAKKKDRMYKAATITIVIVLIISIFLALFQNVFAAKTPAAAIGDEKVYPYELNYYYYNNYVSTYNSLQQTWGDYVSYFLNPELSLKSQKYSSDMSWHDYILESALTTVQQVHALCDEANAAGVTLTQANLDAVQADYDSVYDFVVNQNEGQMDYYLRYVYGNGMTEDEYKRLVSNTYLAQQYSDQIKAGFTFETSALNDYYAANRNSFDVVDYRYFYFAADITDTMTEAEQTAAKTSAHSLAEIMMNSVTGEESFINLAYQYAGEDEKEQFEDENATLAKGATYSSATIVTTEGADWLFSDTRTNGDVAVFDSTNGSYVVLFSNRYRDEYNTASVRHILVTFQLDEESTSPTAEQDAAAKSKIDEILADFEEGDKSEDSFAALAVERSEDPGSAANGGLYTRIYKGQMVSEFENWCFDEDRQPGDYEIVKTSYGYHLMYFVGTDLPRWQVQVEDTLRAQAYDEYMTELLADYTVKRRALGLMSIRLPK